MESPVRIKTGYLTIVALFVITVSCNAYPSQNVSTEEIQNEAAEVTTPTTTTIGTSTTLATSEKSEHTTFRFHPRNGTAWLYQRKNGTEVRPTPLHQILNSISTTPQSIETTPNQGSKINFRGSVKYFVTRPPFKPKSVHAKKNITLTTESSSTEKAIEVPKTYSSKISSKSRSGGGGVIKSVNATENSIVSESKTHINITSTNDFKVTTEATLEVTTEKIQSTSKSSRKRARARTKKKPPPPKEDADKSFDYEFNIDKYTSPEFHDVNNVYSQQISPEVQHYLIPDNASDYFVSVGSAPYEYKDDYRPSVTVGELTTPRDDDFDKRFREISEGIKQHLAEAEVVSEQKLHTERFDETPAVSRPSVNLEDFFSQKDSNGTSTKIVIKNTKELILSDQKDSKRGQGSNGTRFYYEMTLVSTEKYNPKATTTPPPETRETTTFSQLASNEVINMLFKPNLTRRADFKNNNQTRKEYLTTVRMRTPTTPKPRVRILFKNNTRHGLLSSKFNKEATTTLPPSTTRGPLIKMAPVLKKDVFSTVSASIDPIFQFDNSPTRISDTDNIIPMLSKRGSNKYIQDNDNDTLTIRGEKNETSNFNLPPTATAAWALISLKDTPVAKRNNNTVKDEATDRPKSDVEKSDEELQKIDKTSDTKLDTNKKQQTHDRVPMISDSREPTNSAVDDEDDEDMEEDDDEHGEATSATRISYTMIDRPKNIMPSINSTVPSTNKSQLELTTKQSDTSTTSLYDSETTDFTSEGEDFYTTTEDAYSTTDTQRSEPSSTPREMNDIVTKNSKYSSKLDSDMTQSQSNIRIKEIKMETTTAASFKSTTDDISNVDIDSEEMIWSPFSVSTMVSPNDLVTTDMTDFTSESAQDTTYTNNYISTVSPLVDYGSKLTYSAKTDKTTSSTVPTTTVFSNTIPYISSTTQNRNKDIEAASTVYYTTTDDRMEFLTSHTTEAQMATTTNFKITTPTVHTTTAPTTTTTISTTTTTTTPTTVAPEDKNDSREGKEQPIDDDNLFSLPESKATEEWFEAPKTTINAKHLDSNEIPTTSNNNKSREEPKDDLFTYKSVEEENIASTHSSNIEMIEPNHEENNHQETTPIYFEDMEIRYDSSIDGPGAVAAITISVIGVIALLLLIGLLMVVRGRRRSGGYGQRCTPVSLDSYSLDNVSVTGSTRRKTRGPSKRSYGNPAYDESGATSHPMQFAALANFALDQDSIISEFNEIPTITAKADEVPSGCESKNRYSNVIPLPETRVILKTLPGDDTSDYINANFVRGPKGMKDYYIASQAPLASTVNDFWRMIWEQNTRVILMLTELMENGSEKCYEYIPPSEVSDSRRVFGDHQIVLKKREVREKYAISLLQVKSLRTQATRDITHMWYFWPAKGVPDECHSIIAFLIEARSYLKAAQNAKDNNDDGDTDADDVRVYNVQKSEQAIKNGGGDGTMGRRRCGPMLVHCSPGTGRTGALIACDIGIRDFEMNRTVDVPKTVYRIRRDRANAVQTKDQYIFVYKILSEYATKLTGGILDSI